MEFRKVLENQKYEYNRFVTDSESGSFLQSWEWGEWQEVLGRQVFRFKRIGFAHEHFKIYDEELY
jgi:photosystem II stability/assembly factor-like uncharacterized protein